VYRQRYLVERGGKQGLIVAVEGGYDRMRPLDRIDRFQYQQADLGGRCLVHRSIVRGKMAEKQPLIADILRCDQNKLRTI
jgi:hypothetical protein